MDTNEVVRTTIIWDLEESLKKKDAEIERLREALQQVIDLPEDSRIHYKVARLALQQKESE